MLAPTMIIRTTAAPEDDSCVRATRRNALATEARMNIATPTYGTNLERMLTRKASMVTKDAAINAANKNN